MGSVTPKSAKDFLSRLSPLPVMSGVASCSAGACGWMLPRRTTPAEYSTDEAGAGSGVEALGWVTVSLSWVGSMASVLVVVTICLVSRAFPGLGSVPIAQCLARGFSSARTCDVQKECDRASGGRFSV